MADAVTPRAVLAGTVRCRHGDAVLSHVEKADGSVGVLIWCRECKTPVSREKGFPGVWIKQDDSRVAGILAKAGGARGLPLAYSLVEYRMCEGRCRRLAPCQLHHFAIQCLFGDEADEWPVFWLCQHCHDRWHSMVTPDIRTTAKDPRVYAAQLILHMDPERLYALTKALVTHHRRSRLIDATEAAD